MASITFIPYLITITTTCTSCLPKEVTPVNHRGNWFESTDRAELTLYPLRHRVKVQQHHLRSSEKILQRQAT